MAYTPYVTPEEYASFGYTLIPECERYSLLKKASRHIDTLTGYMLKDLIILQSFKVKPLKKLCVSRQNLNMTMRKLSTLFYKVTVSMVYQCHSVSHGMYMLKMVWL